MTPRAIARQYANALFDVVRQTRQVEAAQQDLAGLAALMRSSEELRRVFETPAVPPQKKKAIVERLIAADGSERPMTAEVRRLLVMLAQRDRLMFLGAIAEAYDARAMEASRTIAAEIVSAVPLTDDRKSALAAAFGAAVGRTVQITARVDPEIVGGVVATVGGTVFDGSVTGQIQRMRQKLLAGA